MERESNPGEVAQLLAQIETEYRAAQSGLTGLAETARHTFITARMERVHQLHSSLQTIIGADAIQLIAERLEALPE